MEFVWREDEWHKTLRTRAEHEARCDPSVASSTRDLACGWFRLVWGMQRDIFYVVLVRVRWRTARERRTHSSMIQSPFIITDASLKISHWPPLGRFMDIKLKLSEMRGALDWQEGAT